MISAVVLTRNEENNIITCIKSIEWCDEIIVIDDNSSDSTISKIKELKNKKIQIFSRPLSGNFSGQRNFALEKVKNEWVLFVDADEKLTESLQFEIVNTVTSSMDSVTGYFIRRIDIMWGKEIRHGEPSSVKLLRLAKKEAGKWTGNVHEEWKVHGKVGELKNPLLHFPHPDLATFLNEINFYTDLRASELYYKNHKFHISQIVIYPILKFIYNYFFKMGFLDGMPGLIIAITMSFHSFLARGKLRKIWLEK